METLKRTKAMRSTLEWLGQGRNRRRALDGRDGVYPASCGRVRVGGDDPIGILRAVPEGAKQSSGLFRGEKAMRAMLEWLGEHPSGGVVGGRSDRGGETQAYLVIAPSSDRV